MKDATKGVSPVIGLVLLIGMVAIGSIGLFVVGGQMMTGLEQQAEQERVEQSFIELRQTISTEKATRNTQGVTLNAGERGAIVREATGSYNFTVANESGERSIGNGTIGTIEYEGDDGTTIAYEAGAVFRETGAETRVISRPPFNYDHETNTLNFPMVALSGGDEISSGELRIDHKDATRNSVEQVREHRFYFEIESDYCRGWEQYFSAQAGQTSIEESCAAGEANTVRVRLGYDELEDAFSDSVGLPNGEDSISGKDNHNPFDSVAERDFQSIDGTIDLLVESTEEDEFDNVDDVLADENETLDDGKYYTDGIRNEQLSFDLSDGDAMLVVNGSIQTQNKDDGITVSDCGDGNHLRVYVTGDIGMDNGGTIGPDCGGDGDETTIQVYGTSETDVLFDRGNPSFTGLLYAAGGEIDFQGSPDFSGSIIADSINIDSNLNNVEAVPVESADVDVIPDGYEPAPQITHLNVVTHTVEISNK